MRAFPLAARAPFSPPQRFEADRITREVFCLVEREFPDSPGDATAFDHPVTPADARRAFEDFIAKRLPRFGHYQDAMASCEPYLYHSLLSSSLNLHLLKPWDAIDAALVAYAYAHHIQRLMVLGLFTMLLGVRPYDVHRWHMSMYIDAVNWVSLPNVLGMSQYGDGGIVGSKPYCASGNYINRMSDYCKGCRYHPGEAIGDGACPISTLYCDFLSRNRTRLRGNRRMGFQFKNLARKTPGERHDIKKRADHLKAALSARTYL